MARMDNLLLGDLHGSISGLTFYGGPGRQKVRMKTSPRITASPALIASQHAMGTTSPLYKLLSVGDHTLWNTFGSTIFTTHDSGFTGSASGYQAYVGCYKFLKVFEKKLISFVYEFDSGGIVAPVGVTNLSFISPPAITRLTNTILGGGGTALSLSCDNIEMRSDFHVKFIIRVMYAPPVPPNDNNWIDFNGIRYAFCLFASDQVTYMNAPAKNYYRFCLGQTGYIVNPLGSLANCQTVTFEFDCSPSVADFNTFPQTGQYLWLNLQVVSDNGDWQYIPWNFGYAPGPAYSICVPIVNAFSF